jgi:hypothetical protein
MTRRFDTSPSEAPPQACDPADACTSWTWIRETLAPLGLTILVCEWPLGHGRCPGPLLAREISLKLEASELGQFDAVKLGKLTRFFFNVAVSRIAEALQLVESELQARDLLSGVKIGYADSEAGVWRSYYPKAGTGSL